MNEVLAHNMTRDLHSMRPAGPKRVIDAHQHIWRIGGLGQSWPDAGLPLLHRNFTLVDLRAATEGVNLASTVLVQAQPDDRDTDWMLDEADRDPLVGAVVGWVDLASPFAPQRITALATHSKLRGVRPMLQAIGDPHWILRDDLKPALAALCNVGLRFDALVQPRHLPALATFASRWPDLPMVIDHGAKPAIAEGLVDPWRSDMTALARNPNVWCKLSGLRTEQAPEQSPDCLHPYVSHLVSSFPERLMWGSDWPVLLNAGVSYVEWLSDCDSMTNLPEVARADLFADAAGRFYGLDHLCTR